MLKYLHPWLLPGAAWAELTELEKPEQGFSVVVAS